MKSLCVAIVFVAVIFAFGCVSSQGQMVGNDRDAHGCIGSAGYTWCEASQKCIRTWEENCTAIKFRVVTEEFPPYNYRDANGNAMGQSTETVKEIMKRVDAGANIEIMSWTDAYNIALAGPNVVLYSTGRTPLREDLFKWVGPIASWDFTFYAPKGSKIMLFGADDAKKVGKICVAKDDAREQFLLEKKFTNIDAVALDGECPKRLVDGQADLWLGSSSSFDGIMEDARMQKGDVQEIYQVKKNLMYIALSNDVSDGIAQKWQAALVGMKQDGTFDRITAKYANARKGGELPGMPALDGADRDANGCIGSAGYTWCDAAQKCIRPWEEDCASSIMPGSDRDEHGCIGSAGYAWCENTQKCIRGWEENCTESMMPGSDRDANGCIPSAGYTWCAAMQKCIRPWEENCTAPMMGSDRDSHGCIGSAGYAWCEAKQACIRAWEEDCASPVQKEARKFCNTTNVAGVYTCGQYVRVVSSLIGGGSTFYMNGSMVAQCPLVSPDYISAQCNLLLFGNNCIEQQVC